MALREADMSRSMADRLRAILGAVQGKGLSDPTEREGSVSGAIIKALEQLAIDTEALRCRVDELEEYKAEQEAWAYEQRDRL